MTKAHRFLPAALLLLVIGVGVACLGARGLMAPRKLTVNIREIKGRLVASPDTLRMARRDQVRWIHPEGRSFRVEFAQGRSPFSKSVFSATEAKSFRKLQSSAPAGDFKYSVITTKDTLDPVIRISEPPPPGGDSSGIGVK